MSTVKSFIIFVLKLFLFIFLFLVLNGAFILQTAVTKGPLYIQVFKFIPIAIVSYFIFHLFQKYVLQIQSDKFNKKLKMSLSAIILSLSLLFHQFNIASAPIIDFSKSKHFSHLQPYSHEWSFTSRVGVSFIEYINLLPKSKSYDEIFKAFSNISYEVSLTLFFKDILSSNNKTEFMCKEFKQGGFSKCFISLYQHFNNNYKMSPSFHVLMIAVAAMAILKHKDMVKEEHKDSAKLFKMIKFGSYLIELINLSLEEFKKYILSEKNQIYFYGHHLKRDSLLDLVYQFTSIRTAGELITKKDNFIEGLNKKIQECNCVKDFSHDEKKAYEKFKQLSSPDYDNIISEKFNSEELIRLKNLLDPKLEELVSNDYQGTSIFDLFAEYDFSFQKLFDSAKEEISSTFLDQEDQEEEEEEEEELRLNTTNR